jgi:HAE1 family hydrophobic/amphiphilic exporter-1
MAVASPAMGQSTHVAVNTGETLKSRAIEPETDIINLKQPAPRPEALNLSRVGVQTAQPLPLSLREAILRALEANNTIEISRGDVRFQETQFRSLRGIYDPTFTAQPNFSQTSTTGSSATHDFRLNTNVFQFIEPGGGNYTAFFNNSRTESAFSQAQATSGTVASVGRSALFSSALGVTYNQPLFRNFTIDSRRQQIKIAKKRLEETDVDFRNQALTTINQVERAYWDLVFALRDQQNRVDNLNLSRENLRLIEAKIEAGAAAPLERAEVATELANRESDLLLATQQVSITENTLKQLVLRDAISAEWAASYVPTELPTVGLTPVDLDAALKDAMDNRYELKRLKLERDINAIDIKYFKGQTKPQIDFNSTFSLNGFSRNPTTTTDTIVPLIFGDPNTNANAFLLQTIRTLNPNATINVPNVTIPGTPQFLSGGFNRSLSNLFRSDAPNFSIGMTISFPFRNQTAKANLAGARITGEQLAARTRSQEQVVVVEVRNAVQAVETARQRFNAARSARENAEIQLDGERKLYDAGKSTTFFLFQRENALTTARNAEIRAETDYRKAVSDLQRATSTTFRENKIEVESPLAKN